MSRTNGKPPDGNGRHVAEATANDKGRGPTGSSKLGKARREPDPDGNSRPDTKAVCIAARDAYAANLCVLPPKEDGSKAPLVNWKTYQAERPTPEQLRKWY